MPLSTLIQESRFYAFYNPEDLPTLDKAIVELEEYLTAEGPFDAVLGFSAGAVLAALCMAVKSLRGEEIPVKCVIFVASASCNIEKTYLGLDQGADSINIPIPTAHIWGANDTTSPTGGQDLSLLFDASLRAVFVHDGGHEFPRKESLTEAARVMQRALHQGREMSE
ncbi:hypothetical protein KVR01_012075 [Diaporthe batatas]|uniref:uncharacterized protein n=1 Tax=Diaporthe batatas TaxID=748121 RepID=UPI001D050CFB|nr:uncharacterized protein KVR01_012075 [Diaporthe batatas]KAG8158314.1 hypothetical protein KVR01_012075 [Diaporthe batatas]